MLRVLIRYTMAVTMVVGASLSPALATFHLMAIQEVFPGTQANPQAQYVMLRMTSSGQTLVGSNSTFLEVQDASGTPLGRFGAFDHNVSNGGAIGCSYPSCPPIIIGTSAAQTLLGFSFDQIVDAQVGHVALPLAGGRLCFAYPLGTVDCVAWGNFTGSNITSTINGCDGNFGSPAAALALDFALTRGTFNCLAKENSTDFSNRFPHPVANNGANSNSDGDGDGLISVLDCSDSDSSSLYFPVEVTGDNVVAVATTTVSWNSQSNVTGISTRYDIVTGLVSDLASSKSYVSATCLQSGINGVSLADPRPDPVIGQIFYYLIRAANQCGKGTFGDSSLVPDPRDALDGPTGPCP